MNILLYAALFLAGLAFFSLSFFVKNKEDRFLVTVLSCLSCFVIAAASIVVTTLTDAGETAIISDKISISAIGLMFVGVAIIQFLRLFYVSYEDLSGEYRG